MYGPDWSGTFYRIRTLFGYKGAEPFAVMKVGSHKISRWIEWGRDQRMEIQSSDSKPKFPIFQPNVFLSLSLFIFQNPLFFVVPIRMDFFLSLHRHRKAYCFLPFITPTTSHSGKIRGSLHLSLADSIPLLCSSFILLIFLKIWENCRSVSIFGNSFFHSVVKM